MSVDVERWLRECGLEAYVDAFAENHITMDMLQALSDFDLKELGLSVGHRIQFRRAVERLSPAVAGGTSGGEDTRAALALHGERKLVSVLFCDIVQSTVLAGSLDPEELDEVLRRFYAESAAIASRLGGCLTERLGDGVSCVFGWPRAHEDDPQRAIHAALAMVEEMPKQAIPSLPDWSLQVRVSVATGHVVLTSTDEQAAPDIVGRVLSLAERMKDVCPVSGVVIDEDTRELIGTDFELIKVKAGRLKGFNGTAEIYQVIAPAAGVSRFESHHRGDLESVVGRDGDLALLHARWDLAREHEGQVVLVSGQAGIGKSRLAVALADHVAAFSGRHQLYQCSPISQNTALYPLINYLARAAGVRRTEPPAERLAKLRAFLGSEQPVEKEVVEVFAELLAIPAHKGFEPAAITPDDLRQRTFEVVLSQMERVARSHPLLITVEDAHWIDPSSMELLTAIAHESRQLAVLMLVTSRDPDLAERWSSLPNFTHLKLNRLSESQSRELCQRVLVDADSLKPRIDLIIRAADGVPLFIEALAKMTDPSKVVGSDNGHQARDDQTKHFPVPDQLFGFLAERLDRLGGGPHTRQIAQAAAVLGREFTLSMLQSIRSLQDVPDLPRRVEELVQAEIFVRNEARDATMLDFRHALFREVAYARLLRATRRQLHGEIAAAIEETWADVVEMEPEVVAYHYTVAENLGKAIRFWTLAGDRALGRSATSEALHHYSNGLELVAQFEAPEALELELPLRVGFGAAASAIEGYSAQTIERNYNRMLQLADWLSRHDEKFRAHLGLGAFHEVRGNLEEAQRHCRECLRAADVLGDRQKRLHAHRLMGEIEFYRGAFAHALEHLDACLELYKADEHAQLINELGDDPGVLSLMYRALTQWFLGFPDRAVESCRQGLDLAKTLRHEFTSAQADFYAAWLHAFLREPERAKEYADRSIARCRDKGFALVEGQAQVIKGWALSMMGEPSEGEREIDLGMERVRGPNADICESCFLTLQAEHCLRTGDPEKGLRLIEESEAAAAHTSERFADAERLRLRGELRARQAAASGEAADFAECFRQAIARAESQESLSIKLRAALGLCRALGDAAEGAEARRLLETVYNAFEDGRDTADQREARTILAIEGTVYGDA